MWRASGKRTRSRAAGASVGRVLPRRTTRGRRRLIFSAPSAPPKGKVLGLSCPPATARPWLCISRKSRLQSPGAHAILLLDEAGWHISTKLLRDVDEVQFAESGPQPWILR